MRKMLNLIGLGGKTALPAIIACAAACLLSVSSAKAALTATWSNWTASPQTAALAGTGPITSGSITGDANVQGSINVTTPTTGGNNAGSIASGGSYILETPSNNGHQLAGSTFTISLNLSGAATITDIQLAYICGSATLSPTSITWVVGGSGSSGTISTTTLSGTTWTAIDLSLTGVATTGTSITITGTLVGGATGTGGTLGFDDVQVTAVPEPTNYALAGFGLMFVGVGAGRFYLARRRSASAR